MDLVVEVFRMLADAIPFQILWALVNREMSVNPTAGLTEAHRIAHDAEHTLTHAAPKPSSALVHAYPRSLNDIAMPVALSRGPRSV